MRRGGTELQNVLNAGISCPPMLGRDSDETCIKFFPGLGQVGFSHYFLCLLFKSWRKLIKRWELFWKTFRKSSLGMEFSLGCQLQRALESYFSSILERNLLDVLSICWDSPNSLIRPWRRLTVISYIYKRKIFKTLNYCNFFNFWLTEKYDTPNQSSFRACLNQSDKINI